MKAIRDGTTTRNMGYVLQRTHFNGRSRYTPQHRVVMSQKLGRPLRKTEYIHHKNGLRHDNRIENLELWTVRQPYGQRVSDLIKFVTTNYPDETRAALA